MIWILYSYTEVIMPLEPFTGQYILGIAENTDGSRTMVQIEERYHDSLSVGVHGLLSHKDIDSKEITIFTPLEK